MVNKQKLAEGERWVKSKDIWEGNSLFNGNSVTLGAETLYLLRLRGGSQFSIALSYIYIFNPSDLKNTNAEKGEKFDEWKWSRGVSIHLVFQIEKNPVMKKKVGTEPESYKLVRISTAL